MAEEVQLGGSERTHRRKHKKDRRGEDSSDDHEEKHRKKHKKDRRGEDSSGDEEHKKRKRHLRRMSRAETFKADSTPAARSRQSAN